MQLDRMFDVKELLHRAAKYLLEGLMVALAAFAIPKKSLSIDEIVLISLTASATFCLMDAYAPTIAGSVRTGAGFGIGANMVGFPN